MAKIITSHAVRIIALGLLFGTFAFSVAGCEMGYERDEIEEEEVDDD